MAVKILIKEKPMVLWHVILAIVLAKIAGKKIKQWLESPDVKKEFIELVEIIEKALEDGKITIDEVPDILKEAIDVVKVILGGKGGGK